jgi:hypothetical protein
VVPAEVKRIGRIIEHEENAAPLAPERVDAGIVGTTELEAELAAPTDTDDERAAAGAVGRS